LRLVPIDVIALLVKHVEALPLISSFGVSVEPDHLASFDQTLFGVERYDVHVLRVVELRVVEHLL